MRRTKLVPLQQKIKLIFRTFNARQWQTAGGLLGRNKPKKRLISGHILHKLTLSSHSGALHRSN